MKKLILAAFALTFAVAAHAEQPCSGRSGGTLYREKNYDNVLPSTQAATVKAQSVKSVNSANGTR